MPATTTIINKHLTTVFYEDQAGDCYLVTICRPNDGRCYVTGNSTISVDCAAGMWEQPPDGHPCINRASTARDVLGCISAPDPLADAVMDALGVPR